MMPTKSYSSIQELSHHSRATLYRALRRTDGRPVVLKVLDAKHCLSADIDRLRNEFDLGRVLEGLAGVEPLALTTFEGLPALELTSFAGAPLDQLVGVPMPLEPLLRLGVSIAAALADIHERGLIHKDLK